MSAYHRTSDAIKRARKARALVVLPTACWRCGGVIEPGQRFHMGHIVDVAAGGQDSGLAPEHIQCNLHAGGQLGGRAKAERARRRKAGGMPTW